MNGLLFIYTGSQVVQTNQGDQDELEKVQQKAVSMMTGLTGTSHEDKCKELGLQTLKARRLEQDLSLAHKFINGDIEGGSSIFQKMNQQGRITQDRQWMPPA